MSTHQSKYFTPHTELPLFDKPRINHLIFVYCPWVAHLPKVRCSVR